MKRMAREKNREKEEEREMGEGNEGRERGIRIYDGPFDPTRVGVRSYHAPTCLFPLIADQQFLTFHSMFKIRPSDQSDGPFQICKPMICSSFKPTQLQPEPTRFVFFS